MAEQITVVVDQPRTITNVTRQNVATSVQRTAQTTSLTRQQVGTVAVEKIAVADRTAQTTTVGLPGLQGPPGATGAPTVTLPAAGALQGHFLVRSDGTQFHAVDTSNPDHAAEVVGIALGSTSAAGQSLTAQTAGPITDSNWSWAPGVVWCGADGRLTQTPPSLGWLMQAGRVISPTTVDIDIEQPIYRA